MNFHLETLLYVTTHPLPAHFIYLKYLNNRIIWTHQNPHLIKIQWNLFGGYRHAPILKVSKGNVFFTFPPIWYFPCHLCGKLEENVLVLFFFLQKRLLLLCLLTGVELIIMVSSFEVIMETIWPWRSEAPRTSEKGARACWFIMSNSDFCLLHYTYVEAGRHKLCSNYPNTWPGDPFCEDAAVFHLSYTWMIFSLYFTQDTFSVNIW